MLVGLILGIAVGAFAPKEAVQLKVLRDVFIAPLMMLIGHIILSTIVIGISQSGDMKKVGRMGGKASLYFETISNVAPLLGLVIINVIEPGKGLIVDSASFDTNAVASCSQKAQDASVLDFFLSIIPKSLTDAFTHEGTLLLVLFLAILTGQAIMHVVTAAKPMRDFFEALSQVLFMIVELVILLGTPSSVSVLVLTMNKLEKLGCSKSVVGIDRFMSEARALTNTTGNSVAAIAVSRWEKELDQEQLTRELC